MIMAAVEVRDLSWNFTGKFALRALNGVSMAAERSAVTVLLGPNGSGKTTLLRCISGGLRAARGAVLIDGEDIAGLSENMLARRMALVPQHSSMAFGFTALDIVLMGRHPYIGRFGSESDQDLRIAYAAMEGTGVLPLAQRSVTTLSGGEWQRVTVARALCQQTGILLLDEPVSNLDLRHQTEVLDLAYAQAKERGAAVVCVLHDLNLAAQYADRVVVLSEGAQAAQGAPEDVLTEELVRRVWQSEVIRSEHPQTGKPYFLPAYGERMSEGRSSSSR